MLDYPFKISGFDKIGGGANMSATIINFPARPVKPDVPTCAITVAACNHDPEALFALTMAALTMVQNKREQHADSATVSESAVDNGLMLAFLALAEMLGVTRLIPGELA
jgi:hypothetical protein